MMKQETIEEDQKRNEGKESLVGVHLENRVLMREFGHLAYPAVPV
jgi:hypothetical protein